MTYNTPEGKKIYILTRDINGKKLEWEFENEDDFFSIINNHNDDYFTDEDEILIVKYDGDVIYCSLNDVVTIYIDDVIGFFG